MRKGPGDTAPTTTHTYRPPILPKAEATCKSTFTLLQVLCEHCFVPD